MKQPLRVGHHLAAIWHNRAAEGEEAIGNHRGAERHREAAMLHHDASEMMDATRKDAQDLSFAAHEATVKVGTKGEGAAAIQALGYSGKALDNLIGSSASYHNHGYAAHSHNVAALRAKRLAKTTSQRRHRAAQVAHLLAAGAHQALSGEDYSQDEG